jgi:hypothetical protein
VPGTRSGLRCCWRLAKCHQQRTRVYSLQLRDLAQCWSDCMWMTRWCLAQQKGAKNLLQILQKEFEIKDIGPLKMGVPSKFLGMELQRMSGDLLGIVMK